MKPSVGRIVHLNMPVATSSGDKLKPHAAVVTDVNQDGMTVDLQVLTRGSVYPYLNCPYSEEPKPNHWSWPPREEAPVKTSKKGS